MPRDFKANDRKASNTLPPKPKTFLATTPGKVSLILLLIGIAAAVAIPTACLLTAGQTTTASSATNTASATTIIGCHLCPGSSYAGSCNSCTNSSAGCYITCLCTPISGPAVNSSVTLQTGAGNGCNLGNNNGNLTCGSYCT